MAKWDNPIGIPFAESGDRDAIPDTSESGNVNNTTGFGNKYETDPAVGGLWLYRQTMNSLFYNLFSSIKEIQTKVPISVNGTAPDASGNISITMPAVDGGGIKVIDDNTTDITSFNQITEDGIYYVYKKLSDAPSYDNFFGTYIPINLIVINVKDGANSLDTCIQLVSTNLDGFGLCPSNIGIMPFLRSMDKDSNKWSSWFFRYGIVFNFNNISIEKFNLSNKSDILFPIIAKDSTFPDQYNIFMYSATKEQMREQLGIQDPVEPIDTVEKWKTYTPTISDANRCHSAMYRIYDREINGLSCRGISIIAVVSINITRTAENLYSFAFGLPEDIKLYNDGTVLKNGGMASIVYSLTGMPSSQTGGKDINATACYIGVVDKLVYPSFTIFSTAIIGYTIQSAILTFQIDALIDDRTLAPTPASIAVTKIQGNQVTITYTRGN